MRVRGAMAAVAAALLVAGCGMDRSDRFSSGPSPGAAAVGGVSVGPGALVGAGVGAGTDAMSDTADVHLGSPIWR